MRLRVARCSGDRRDGAPGALRVRNPSAPSALYQPNQVVTAWRLTSSSWAMSLADRPSKYPSKALARRHIGRSDAASASRNSSRKRLSSASVRRSGTIASPVRERAMHDHVPEIATSKVVFLTNTLRESV